MRYHTHGIEEIFRIQMVYSDRGIRAMERTLNDVTNQAINLLTAKSAMVIC